MPFLTLPQDFWNRVLVSTSSIVIPVVGTNNKDNVHWVMISHFLLSCTPLVAGSVRQWKLIFFSLRGDITVINFSMKWWKLEDSCNLRSEINLVWCEKSWGNTGHKQVWNYPLPLSSNRRKAAHAKTLLCQKCDPLGPQCDQKDSEMKFSPSFNHYFNITHTHTGYRKFNQEPKIKRNSLQSF